MQAASIGLGRSVVHGLGAAKQRVKEPASPRATDGRPILWPQQEENTPERPGCGSTSAPRRSAGTPVLAEAGRRPVA